MVEKGDCQQQLVLSLKVDKRTRRARDEEDRRDLDVLFVRDARGYGFPRNGLLEEFPHLFVRSYKRVRLLSMSTRCFAVIFDSPLLGTLPTHMTHSLRLGGAAG